MPSSPASTARRSIWAFMGPRGRAQPSVMGVSGMAARAVSKKAPISSTEGGVTPCMAVPVRGIRTTSTSSFGRWRATMASASHSPSMRPRWSPRMMWGTSGTSWVPRRWRTAAYSSTGTSRWYTSRMVSWAPMMSIMAPSTPTSPSAAAVSSSGRPGWRRISRPSSSRIRLRSGTCRRSGTRPRRSEPPETRIPRAPRCFTSTASS